MSAFDADRPADATARTGGAFAAQGTHPEAGTDADHGHDHPPHLAHHFDTPEQQFDTAKIGMWVFLATEILMFGGLFCAYAVYRYNNPDVFRYSEHHLNTALGATNTVVLLASSLTMALAVRAAQLGQQTYLKLMLAFTLLGAVGFLCIKSVEYGEKFAHGLFPGRWNVYDKHQNEEGFAAYFAKDHGEHGTGAEHGEASPVTGEGDGGGDTHEGRRDVDSPEGAAVVGVQQSAGGDDRNTIEGSVAPQPLVGATPADQQPADSPGRDNDSGRQNPVENQEAPAGESLAFLGAEYLDPNLGTGDAALTRPAFNSPEGTYATLARGGHGGHQTIEYEDLTAQDQQNVKAFFNIYYMMTGLHGVHVLIGMGLIGWVMFKSLGNVFGPAYYTPVDLVGLYWHLVDLIWIFLFPLLYLIH